MELSAYYSISVVYIFQKASSRFRRVRPYFSRKQQLMDQTWLQVPWENSNVSGCSRKGLLLLSALDEDVLLEWNLF